MPIKNNGIVPSFSQNYGVMSSFAKNMELLQKKFPKLWKYAKFCQKYGVMSSFAKNIELCSNFVRFMELCIFLPKLKTFIYFSTNLWSICTFFTFGVH
jgi:hypothetical protein